MARRQTAGPDPRIEALRAEPPARFVAARDALARALAAAGDPRAAEVQRMRKPTRRVWMLNRLARERRAEIDELLEAGARVRRAHAAALHGRRDAGLRAADESMSAALDTLVGAARALASDTGRDADHGLLVGVREDLRALATGGATDAARLRSGMVERLPAARGEGSLWGLAAAPAPAAGSGRGSARTGPAPRKARVRTHARGGTTHRHRT